MFSFGGREEETPPGREEAAGGQGEGEPPLDIAPIDWEDPASSPRFQILEPEEPVSEPAPYGQRAGTEGWTTDPGQPPAAAGEAAKPGAKRRWLVTLREVVETVLLALLIFLAVRASFQNFRVEGLSMSASLDDGQYLIVNKLAYATIDLKVLDWLPFFDAGEDSVHHLFGSPGRGDVIVFQSLQNLERDFIKRIIGVPGDRVELRDGKLFLNGEALDEPYAQGPTSCTGQWCSVTVSEGHYFVLGDNRPQSSDSRSFGLVPEDNIVGKAFFSYWPPEDAGLAPNHGISYAKDSNAPGE